MATKYPQEIVDAAKFMWLRRVPPKEIADKLGLNSVRVLYQWVEKHAWNAMVQHETVEQATSRRLIALIEKDEKTDGDYKEIDKLTAVLDRLAGIEQRKAKTAREKAQAAQPESGGRDRSKRRKAKQKNEIGEITAEQLAEVRNDLFFKYQHLWFENRHHRTRFILKSRQIGATFFFAWEAFEDAILTGDNQIFLSASKAQAAVFKAYIMRFALEYFDVELKGGDCISLTKDGKPWAELRFISTNARTAQGYHGHLYFDEVFWTQDFERLENVASGMASQKKWRKTYFRTPSIKSHGAYPMWSGDKYNKERKRKVEFDLSHESLVNGQVGPDKIWRCITTIEDAEKGGCTLFDIEQLKEEKGPLAFRNLFMCHFLEAGLSVFGLSDLLNCATDTNVTWVDFKRRERRPYGNNPVWIGYDPARKGDRSTVVVVAPSLQPGGKFRVLEKIDLKGTFRHQAKRIEELTERYNVQFIGIDVTGPGLGVLDEVRLFYKRATPIHYSPETKNRLVLKAIDVVTERMIEWDAEHTDIPQAFLQVHQVTTGSGQITYAADRTSETGHADVAWAIMHAISNEPLTRKRKKASASF